MSTVLVLSRKNLIVQAHEFDFIFPSGERFRPGDFSIETCDGVIFTFEWKQGIDLLIPCKLASPSNEFSATSICCSAWL